MFDATLEDLVAVRVIEWKCVLMTVVTGFVGDFLDLLEEHPGRGGRHVVRPRRSVVRRDDERRVADDGE